MTRINCTASNESFPSCFLTESVGLKPVYMYFVRGLRCRDCKTNCYDIGNGSEGPQGSLRFRHFFRTRCAAAVEKRHLRRWETTKVAIMRMQSGGIIFTFA